MVHSTSMSRFLTTVNDCDRFNMSKPRRLREQSRGTVRTRERGPNMIQASDQDTRSYRETQESLERVGAPLWRVTLYSWVRADSPSEAAQFAACDPEPAVDGDSVRICDNNGCVIV